MHTDVPLGRMTHTHTYVHIFVCMAAYFANCYVANLTTVYQLLI